MSDEDGLFEVIWAIVKEVLKLSDADTVDVVRMRLHFMPDDYTGTYNALAESSEVAELVDKDAQADLENNERDFTEKTV